VLRKCRINCSVFCSNASYTVIKLPFSGFWNSSLYYLNLLPVSHTAIQSKQSFPVPCSDNTDRCHAGTGSLWPWHNFPVQTSPVCTLSTTTTMSQYAAIGGRVGYRCAVRVVHCQSFCHHRPCKCQLAVSNCCQQFYYSLTYRTTSFPVDSLWRIQIYKTMESSRCELYCFIYGIKSLLKS
jgi:hypothetical protein